MQLTALLSLLAAMVSVIHAQPEPVEQPILRLLGVLGVVTLELGWLSSRLGATSDVDGDNASRDRAEVAWLWIHLASLTAIFGGAQFGTLVSVNLRLSRIPFADEIVALLPAVVPLFWRWSMLDRSPQSPPQINWEPVWAATRLFLVPALLPMLLLCGWMDLVRLSQWQISPQIHGLAALLGAAIFVGGLPHLMAVLWSAKPLPSGTFRSEIERLIDKTGLQFGGILMWNTGDRIANAAVTGLVPGKRHLFFTDGLLKRLTEKQLTAVAAHEVAHCQAGHHRQLLLSLAVPLVVLLSVPNAGVVEGTISVPWLAGLMAAAGVWLMAHGYLARLLEHQADWLACHLLSRGGRPGEGEVELLCSALSAVDPSTRGDWLHPAPLARQAFLSKLSQNPGLEAQFTNRLDWIYRLQISLFAGLFGVCIYSLA